MAKTLYGGETKKAVENFPISGETGPGLGRPLARAHQGRGGARQRRARQARSQARRRDHDRRRRGHGRQPRRPVPDRRLPDRLGHVVEHERQRGHRRAGRQRRAPQRPRQHGPVVQRRLPQRRPPRRAGPRRPTSSCRRSSSSSARCRARPKRFENIVKSGRTHLMDAVPVTLGQEFAGYAAQVRLGQERVDGRARARAPDPARRHRHGHRAQHAPEVRREASARDLSKQTKLEDRGRRPTRSRRRPTATRSSSCRAR